MENRYNPKLITGNQEIMKFHPHHVLREIIAAEIKKSVNEMNNPKIIDLGCGEGDSTFPILEANPKISIEALDLSPEMIKISKEVLKKFKKRVKFIVEDGATYIKSQNQNYDIITSSWTIHNLKQDQKEQLLKDIYNKLKEGGKFILMDKIYFGNLEIQNKMLDHQKARYRYLHEKLREEISSHEDQDFTDDYKQTEENFVEMLKKAGFKNIKFLDRVERDVVLVVEK